MLRAAQIAAAVSLVGLALLCLAWELWLAPLRPGGSWLALKAAPLALPLGGILAARRYTFQWTSLLSLGYFAEGAVRSFADTGTSRALAAGEVALSLLLLAAAIAFARAAANATRHA
ncbi:MAG: DUF2069 domain-containing protein [Betaproteobacteria bacterium]|nr:DUF2069 domain-containing protein [Betaproteobacteria bacterium]